MRFEEIHERLPTQAESDSWVSQTSEHDFRAMRGEAAEFFDNAARDYMDDELKAAKEAGKEDSIAKSVDVLFKT